jgi:hypothetical protein
VAHGEVRSRWYTSEVTGRRHVMVYTPPGYDTDRDKCYQVLDLPHRAGTEIEQIELVQGKDASDPIVIAVTVETS